MGDVQHAADVNVSAGNSVLGSADVNVSVSTSPVPSVSAGSAVVQTGDRAAGPGVHTVTDQACDSEVSAYFRDDSPPPPTPFYYGPSPSRQSTQPRAASRQSVLSVRSHASGRLSTHSQATDPVIEFMNKKFDKVAGYAAAQRADAAEQRAKKQARMEAEMSRRKREVAVKIRLQLRVEQLEREAATALLHLARTATT